MKCMFHFHFSMDIVGSLTLVTHFAFGFPQFTYKPEVLKVEHASRTFLVLKVYILWVMCMVARRGACMLLILFIRSEIAVEVSG
jgi:hypothetical protein